MPRGNEDEKRHAKRPAGARRTQNKKKTGGLGLRRIGRDEFELVHPRCIHEMELDYAEGIELWRAGDPEAARDALRYALQGCGDNLWVHVALGQIALNEFRDPALARGHFGYAFELGSRAIGTGFNGRLPREREPNRPFYEAIEGLIRCYEALSRRTEVEELTRVAARLSERASDQARAHPANRPSRPRSGGGSSGGS
jgi:hypothetical protein